MSNFTFIGNIVELTATGAAITVDLSKFTETAFVTLFPGVLNTITLTNGRKGFVYALVLIQPAGGGSTAQIANTTLFETLASFTGSTTTFPPLSANAGEMDLWTVLEIDGAGTYQMVGYVGNGANSLNVTPYRSGAIALTAGVADTSITQAVHQRGTGYHDVAVFNIANDEEISVQVTVDDVTGDVTLLSGLNVTVVAVVD